MKRFRFLAIAVLVGAGLALGARLAMPLAARALIRSDPLAHADMIVVLSSYRLERTLEAGTLFREGWSGRVLLLRSPDAVNRDLLRSLHVRFADLADIQRDILAQMGVPAAAVIESPAEFGTTKAEAHFVAELARRQRCRRIIVVTSPYHTSRAGRYFRKEAGKSFTVVMRPNRYERIDPDHWWRRPVDRYDVVFEYLKLGYGLVPPE